jgi:hypothetical protein
VANTGRNEPCPCGSGKKYKIPMLDGKTPLEAVKTEAGRRRVVEILKDIENAEERNKKSGGAYFDISWMWERLGITRG